MLFNFLKPYLWIIGGCKLHISAGTIAAVATTVAAVASAAGAISSLASSGDAAGQQVDAYGNAINAGQQTLAQQTKTLGKANNQANAPQEAFYKSGLGANNMLSQGVGIATMGAEPTFADYQKSLAADATLRNSKPKLPKNAKPAQKAQYEKDLKEWQKHTDLRKNIINADPNDYNSNWEPLFNDFKNTKLSEQQAQAEKQKQDPNFGSLLKDNPEQFKFQADPGYEFQKQQGENDLQRRLAAMGQTNSGAALKEGMNFNQGLANTTFKDAWSRYLDRNNIYNQNRSTKYNMLSGVSNSGQQAANNISNNNNNFGQNLAMVQGQAGQDKQNNLVNQGVARSAGTVAQGNAIAGGIDSLAGIAGNYIGGQYGGNALANTGKSLPAMY